MDNYICSGSIIVVGKNRTENRFISYLAPSTPNTHTMYISRGSLLVKDGNGSVSRIPFLDRNIRGICVSNSPWASSEDELFEMLSKYDLRNTVTLNASSKWGDDREISISLVQAPSCEVLEVRGIYRDPICFGDKFNMVKYISKKFPIITPELLWLNVGKTMITDLFWKKQWKYMTYYKFTVFGELDDY